MDNYLFLDVAYLKETLIRLQRLIEDVVSGKIVVDDDYISQLDERLSNDIEVILGDNGLPDTHYD